MSRAKAFASYQRDMGLFSRDAVGVPLHPYQIGWANYVMQVVGERRNEIIVVEMPRQSGKNETSAQLEVAILARHGKLGGDIVKAAPTWKPQIVNSKLRFDARSGMAARRLPFLRFKPTMGYIYSCGRASISFLSAGPEASVVGATASLLMEVDEAQDVDKAKFEKDFSPMRASTAAPVVAYGTTWTDDTLLESFKQEVSEGRSAGRCFRILPETVAEANPAYGDFVDSEIRRKGRDHPLIKTQYFLEPLPRMGRLLNDQKLRLMVGSHARSEARSGEAQIVAGLDFAGADESAGEMIGLSTGSERDSVALSIGRVDWINVADGVAEPVLRLLDRYEWVNVRPESLHTTLYQILWEKWRVNRVHCDGTGIGATSTAFLAAALNKGATERVHAVVFDGALVSHTRLAFRYIAAVNGSRLLDYQPGFDVVEVAHQDAPNTHDPHRHIWWQRGHAKLEAKPGKKVKVYVPENEGHDDLMIADMLCLDAAYEAQQPIGDLVDFA